MPDSVNAPRRTVFTTPNAIEWLKVHSPRRFAKISQLIAEGKVIVVHEVPI